MNYETIKKNSDFRRLYRINRCIITPLFVVYYCKGRHDTVKMGITVSKKLGKAVLRNRIKRKIRQAFNSICPEIKNGYDFIVVARSKAASVKSTKIQEQMERALHEKNLLDRL